MNIRIIKSYIILVVFVVATALGCWGETMTYRIVEFNKSTEAFTLAPSGMRPVGSYAIFENEYGATSGNRYNQVPRNREATLWLEGWEGCILKAVTLSMSSNKSSGTFALKVTSGGEEKYNTRVEAFNSEQWFGQWVDKALNVYVDMTKQFDSPITVDGEVGITIKGGTQEGSVYIDAITVEYDPCLEETESPMGWVYEKVEAKGKINDGDKIMMYRSGSAAGDIDGMELSHYLDAMGIASTTNVDDPFISVFTANHDASGHWTLTNQHGQKLGARSAQNLAWDEGVTTWDITLGYDGATIASTNTKYGTMRYNAPAGSYARFWNYTSKTLALPYIYRRTRQLQPVVSTSISLADSERTVTQGEQDTLVIKHELLPTTTTDRRLQWQSSNERVATVRSGIVSIMGPGTAIITATAMDGGSSATCLINVKPGEGGIPGDVNGDGVVDVSDANIIINIILGNQPTIPAADVNHDGAVDVADVNDIINKILND